MLTIKLSCDGGRTWLDLPKSPQFPDRSTATHWIQEKHYTDLAPVVIFEVFTTDHPIRIAPQSVVFDSSISQWKFEDGKPINFILSGEE